MERLKARRSARRAQNTRIINDGHRVLQDPSPDIAKVRSIKERLTTNNAELLQIDGELEPLIPVEQLKQECIATAEYQDDAVMILSELQSKI